MMTLYQTGLVKVTDKLRMGVMAATGAIFLLYLVSMVMSMFGGGGIGFIHSAGPMGIGFSVLVVGIAAFNLLLDFDLIDRLAANRAPKYMEWYGAFALLVTLVWLYLEILRVAVQTESPKLMLCPVMFPGLRGTAMAAAGRTSGVLRKPCSRKSEHGTPVTNTVTRKKPDRSHAGTQVRLVSCQSCLKNSVE